MWPRAHPTFQESAKCQITLDTQWEWISSIFVNENWQWLNFAFVLIPDKTEAETSSGGHGQSESRNKKLYEAKKKTEEGQSEACSGNLTQPAEEDHKIPIGKEEEIGLKRQ